MPSNSCFFLNTHEKCICTNRRHGCDISISLFFITRTSLNLSKLSSPDIHRRALGSETKTESFGYHHSTSFVRSDLWNTADDSILLTRCSHSHFLSLSSSLSSFFFSSSSPSTFPVHPPPVYVRGSRRITASSRGRLALGNNRHGPNVLSSPPANQVNPINALGRPQTKKLPPGTLALSRERYVFVLKCPFWSSSSVISTAVSNHGK